jgi:hypothetical protein
VNGVSVSRGVGFHTPITFRKKEPVEIAENRIKNKADPYRGRWDILAVR